jgi:glycosyltransferase involved in cell wall biosynthesis
MGKMSTGDEMKDSLMISVVMPVYNVEKYLDKAVQSVLGQTYGCLELILVDDASPDGSGRLCDAWAARDARVRVVHKPKNEGLGFARNTGMEAAGGDYVHFMDSDDWIEADAYRLVADSLRENPAPVVVFGAVEEYRNSRGGLMWTRSVLPASRRFSDAASLRRSIIVLEESTLYGYAWNKVYQLSYLRRIGLKFTDVALIEDIAFNVGFFMDIDALNILGTAPYHYQRRTDGSLTSRFVAAYDACHRARVEMIVRQHEYWGMCTDGVRRAMGNIFFRYIFSALQRNCDRRAGMSRRDRRGWLESLYEDELFVGLSPYVRPDSRAFAAMAGLLRRKRTALVLMTARCLFIVRTRLPALFNRLKARR